MMATKGTKIEERAYLCDVQIREDTEHGHMLEGVPIVIGKNTDLGPWDEVIDAGALAHSTMQLVVMDDGLHIRADLDVEGNPRAKELYSAVSRGDVSGMSFMFTVNKDAWDGLDTSHPTRHITEIGRVFEVSAVTFPAYEQTSINARSMEIGQASLESAKEALESAKKLDALRKEVLERSAEWKKN